MDKSRLHALKYQRWLFLCFVRYGGSTSHHPFGLETADCVRLFLNRDQICKDSLFSFGLEQFTALSLLFDTLVLVIVISITIMILLF